MLQSYSVLLALAFAVGGAVRRAESRRLGYLARPGYRWVTVGMLVGAVVGSKLGMLLYMDASSWTQLLGDALRLETAGKTIIGALFGAYLGVEIVKPMVGLRGSTGDALALALPLALGIGRLGCLLGGCCYGTPASFALSVHIAGADRHPVQLYEAALDFALAGAVLWLRGRVTRPGELFKLTLIGYAVIRILVDPWRGDPRIFLGPWSAVQLACAAGIALLAIVIVRERRAVDATA